MSNPYYNPRFPAPSYPGGATVSAPAQYPYMPSTQPVVYQQYPVGQPAVVQHVVVPVAVPIQPEQAPVVPAGQYGQHAAGYSPPRGKRNSEELSYYLGNDANRKRKKKKSRSSERYSDDDDKSSHSHSRHRNWKSSRSSKGSDRRSRSPKRSRDSRSPHVNKQSRHSYSHSHSDRYSEHREHSRGRLSPDYDSDVRGHSSKDHRNEYVDRSRDVRESSRDRYRRNDERNSYRNDERNSYREQSRDRERYSSSVEKYSEVSDSERGFDRHEEEAMRRQWNESKRNLRGNSRDDDRQDYDTKRRKYEPEFDRGGSLDRGDDSLLRDKYEFEHERVNRDSLYDRQNEYDALSTRESVFDRLSDRHSHSDRDYDRSADMRVGPLDYSEDRYPGSSSRMKVHVETSGRWIEADRDVSPISDDESGTAGSRRSADLNDLNITIKNERAYEKDYDELRSRDILDLPISGSLRQRRYKYDRDHRPILLEDSQILLDDRPKLIEDGIETSRYRGSYRDTRSEKDSVRSRGSSRHRDRTGRKGAKLMEDNVEISRDVGRYGAKLYDDRADDQRHRGRHSRSPDSRPVRHDVENISDTESVSGCSLHSSRHQSRNDSQESNRRSTDVEKVALTNDMKSREQSAGAAVRNPKGPFHIEGKPSFNRIDVNFEVPLLCLPYNSKTGCQDPKCSDWHICQHFVLNKCEYRISCKKGHNFFMGNIYKTLFNYNKGKIDFRQYHYKDVQYKIIGKLREQLRKRTEKPKRVDIESSDGIKVDPEFDARNYSEDGQIKKDDENENKNSVELGKLEQKDKGKMEDTKTLDDVLKENDEGETEPTVITEIEDEDIVECVTESIDKDKNSDEDKKDISKSDEKDTNNDSVKASERQESLSPVSVENIDNWEIYDRYERVSEDGSAVGADELENVSSDEEVPSEDYQLSHHNILAKAAIPIGMNDPLVFNPSKNAPPTALPEQPAAIGEPLSHMTRKAPPRLQVNSRPLFPAADVMGLPMPMTHLPPPPIRARPPFPMVGQMPPGMVRMPPPMGQIPPMGHMPPIGQNAPVNFLPSPSLLQEVIESLQSKQNNPEQAKTSRPKRKCPSDLESLAEKNPELTEIIQTPWQFPHKGVINMTAIDFVTETDAYKEEFVAELLRILITLDLPYVTMKKLLQLIREKLSINIASQVDLKKILSLYPENFQIIETVESDDEDDSGEATRKNIQIKARVMLGFCERHGHLPFAVGRCSCNALHICRHFFLSSCPFKHDCKFGHKLKTNHNMTVFRAHKLHRLTGKEVMAFIRDPDNRNVEMVPEICRFYSREKGECYRGDNTEPGVMCHKLHLCYFFAKGVCYKSHCPRSHSIRDKQPMALLQLHGLDPNVVGEDRVIELLTEMAREMDRKKAVRNAPCQTKKKDINNKETAKTDINQETTNIEKSKNNVSETPSGKSRASPSKVALAVKKGNLKLPTVCKFYNNELGCKKRDWGPEGYCMFVHVCQYFISGDCSFGDKCKRSHDLISGQASLLLQKHGLDTSEFTSLEIAEFLKNPDEVLKQASVNAKTPSKATKPVEEIKVDRSEPESVEDVKKESGSGKQAEGEGASYKSYSVEDILQQIVEKGQKEELMRSEAAAKAEKSGNGDGLVK